MLIIDSDAAIRERFGDSQRSEPSNSRQSSTPRSPNEHQSSEHELPRRLNTGVGWIEVVRPGFSTAQAARSPAMDAERQAESIPVPPPNGELASARGIALGAALGLIAWILIGGLIGIFLA
jgi:hypothetical protein